MYGLNRLGDYGIELRRYRHLLDLLDYLRDLRRSGFERTGFWELRDIGGG